VLGLVHQHNACICIHSWESEEADVAGTNFATPIGYKGGGVTLPPLRDMPRHPILSKLVKEVDRYIAASGIRGNCIKCWNGEYKASHYRQGCCQGCSHLTETGCKAKPVACALWLCNAWHLPESPALIGVDHGVLGVFQKVTRMLQVARVPVNGIREGAWRDEKNWKPTVLQFKQVLDVIKFIRTETKKYGHDNVQSEFRIL
jgi:hypothetical protein